MKRTTLGVAALAAAGLAFTALPSMAGGYKHKSYNHASKHEKMTAYKAAKAERWAAKMEAWQELKAAKRARWEALKASKMRKKYHKHHAKDAPAPLG